MKTRFILNPYSGRNRRRPWLAGAIRDFISAQGLEADLVITEAPGHATSLASEAANAGCTFVVAVGGDGTMNETAQALVGTPTALAMVPCGSGNGLALHLGLPRSLRRALELATGTGGRIAAVDTGTANGLPFFNVMGLGLDAEVSRRFNALTRRGLPAYVRTALGVVRDRRDESVCVTCHGQVETLDVLLLAVANSDQYGNHARIAPGGRADDGLLDLVAVRPVGLAGAAELAARLFLGNFDRSSLVRRWRGRRFVINRLSPGIIHTDGETFATSAAIEVIVHPGSLRVLVPMQSRMAVAPLVPALTGLGLQTP